MSMWVFQVSVVDIDLQGSNSEIDFSDYDAEMGFSHYDGDMDSPRCDNDITLSFEKYQIPAKPIQCPASKSP